MFFNHDELTHGLQTNASNQWIEGVDVDSCYDY